MMNENELKPVRCGCGGEVAVLIGVDKGHEYYRVKCWECGTQTVKKRHKAEAVTVWNCAIGATDTNVGDKERTAKVERVSFGETLTYDFDGQCKCGKWVDTLWNYCPSCGCRLEWE